MTRASGGARRVAPLPGLVLADRGGRRARRRPAFASHPDGAPLASVAVKHSRRSGVRGLRYLHSVTRTPVDERYRIDGNAIVET